MHGMMCQPRSRHRVAEHRPAAVQPPPRSPEDRVGDSDREAAGTLLRQAFADGVIPMEEFDDHLSRAYAATTVGDIDAATAVLPDSYVANLRRAEAEKRAAEAQRRRRAGEIRSYLSVMALLVTIWLVVGVTAGSWYPWPIWPALGWGIPLFASGRGSRPDYDRRHGTFRTDSS